MAINHKCKVVGDLASFIPTGSEHFYILNIQFNFKVFTHPFTEILVYHSGHSCIDIRYQGILWTWSLNETTSEIDSDHGLKPNSHIADIEENTEGIVIRLKE